MSNSTGNSPALPTAMVAHLLHIGRLIVEEEQRGAERAGYGEELLKGLSKRLTADFGKGFSPSNLRYMKMLHRSFSIHHSVSDKLPETHQAPSDESAKRHALSAKSAPCGFPLPQLHPDLSWTHYRHLLKVSDPAARTWYMTEAAEAGLRATISF